jgi:hypothetical protein
MKTLRLVMFLLGTSLSGVGFTMIFAPSSEAANCLHSPGCELCVGTVVCVDPFVCACGPHCCVELAGFCQNGNFGYQRYCCTECPNGNPYNC